MKMQKNSRWLVTPALLLIGLSFTCFSLYALGRFAVEKMPSSKLSQLQIVELLGPYVLKNRLPTSLAWSNDELNLNYTLDPVLQEYADNLLKQARPDYGALVAMDATTGEILSMSSYAPKSPDANLNLVATFPAASVFKLVTSAAAFDLTKVTADSTISFSGRSHTLYRRDVLEEPRSRWARVMSIKEGFALSINCLFGKLGLFYVGAKNLLKYADRYGFNSPIQADFPLPISQAVVPTDEDWSVVEAASGFNRLTTLSPVHGALLAASVVNNGVMMEPHLVKRIGTTREVLYEGAPKALATTVSARVNNELIELMSATIKSGTSRKSFRKLVRNPRFASAKFGGKTGSLDGLNPAGRTEWFIGYVEYRGRKIAIASVLVQKALWHARASQVASSYFEQYLRHADNQFAKN
jgi:cell division protein FtsI/penicillin-binding protein 2